MWRNQRSAESTVSGKGTHGETRGRGKSMHVAGARASVEEFWLALDESMP